MPLLAGDRLGTYEILAPLGAGGMGEVYRARDTRLEREVAVKLLPDGVARDPEHLARFDREAKALAALNHTNIAAIHGIEDTGELRFLVLELVPGETLAERLAPGPLPIEEALRVCRQVAHALEAAHERGIVHRDLKPANIKVTPAGQVKVLDFGLAKSVAISSGSDLSRSPTVAAGTTQEGTVLGTPAYMSPEQARGKPVDKRTDIWSFGCVLYETLTGRRVFEGETSSDILAAILTREPDWGALPGALPEEIRRLLRRCLEKDAEKRLRDAGDAALEIEAGLAESSSSLPRKPQRASARGSSRFATLLRAVPSLLSSSRSRKDSTPGRPQPKLTQVTFAEDLEGFPALSDDGRLLAFCREVGGVRKIVLKDLDTQDEKALTGARADDLQPCWSPDGKSLLFARAREEGRKLEPTDVFGPYEGADVWMLEIESLRETRLVEHAANPAFAPDGRKIAFDASWAGPRRIWMADARGRNPEQVSSDTSEAVVHVRPRWSPDGARIVFQNIERTKFDVRVADLASKTLHWVTNDHFQDIGPVWSPSGRFFYFSSYRSGGLNIWGIPVDSHGQPAGLLQQLTTGPGQDVEAAISRDGRRMAFSILRQNADIWRLPVSEETGRPTGSPERVIATTREDSRGAWSRDGRAIAFNSDRNGEMNIWLHSLSDGSTRQLTRGPGGDYQPNFSPDGGRIAFFFGAKGEP